jgi:hypothetical protein
MGGAVSKVESARVVLVPKWRGLFEVDPSLLTCLLDPNIQEQYHNVISVKPQLGASLTIIIVDTNKG